MAVKMTKSDRFPCDTDDTVQKGQYHIQKASNRRGRVIGDRLLKHKVSHSFPTRRRTPTKNTKHVSGPIPDNQAIPTSDSPLTVLGFNRAQVALQTYYEPYLNIKRVSGDALGLESCYINLVIVEAPSQRQKDKEDLKAQAAAFHRMPSYEKISEVNMEEPIPLEKLFDMRELPNGRKGTPKTILIQGRAGIGKTTLCKKMVKLYQSGLWRDRFDAVLWLPLRQLKGFRARNIEDLMREKYFAQCPEQEREAFVSLLAARTRSGKVLFILDGLDEILTDTRTIGGVALEAFLKHLLRQEHVVITSRPSGVDGSALPNLDLELETIGFSAQNVSDYLRNILKPEDARAVQDFIRRTPSIQNLVNIPVQLDVICYSWDSLPSNGQSVTMTGIYRTIVRRLWSKDAERLPKEVGTPLASQRIRRLPQYQIDRLVAIESEYLSFLAFKGMDNGEIEFDESTLLSAMEELDGLREMANQEHLPLQLLDTLKQTSFLHTADAELDANEDDSQRAWHFLHLTFQEYFSATWIARHLQIKPKVGSALATLDETKAYIRKHKYNPRYQIVWWMVAGMLHGEVLASFFELLQGVPVDLIGGYHHHLLAGCFNECRSQLDNKSVENVEVQLIQWLKLEMTAHVNSYGRSILGGMSYFPEELLIRSIGQSRTARNYLIRTLATRTSLTQYSVALLLNVLPGVQDQDRLIKRTVVEALGKQSTLHESILQALVGALQNYDSDVRKSVAEELGKQSVLPESVLQALIRALQCNDRDVRESAALALGNQSRLSESALQALVGVLQHKSLYVRESATLALGKQSKLPESTLQALIGAFQDKSRGIRESAALALGGQSTLPEPTLRALIGALQDMSQDVRKSATLTLGKQPKLPESTLQALVGALRHESWGVRESAAEALRNQLKLPESTLLALVGLLQDNEGDVKISAALSLGRQSILPESILQVLVGALQGESWNVRKSAAEALGEQSKLPEPVLQALIGALQDESWSVQKSAIEALGKQSKLPESILQTLICALHNNDKGVRKSTIEALGKQRSLPESTFKALVGALQDEHWDVRRSAAEALGNQRTLPESTLKALIGALRHKSWGVRRSALSALRKQSTIPESTLPALIGALQDNNKDVRISAASILGKQSTLPESALEALICALQDESLFVGSSAAEALGKHPPLSISTIQALVGALQYNDQRFRGRVVSLLEQYVKSTFMAVPSLSPSAIGTLHKAFLINYCSKYSASLWVQGHQIIFHIVQGPVKIELCAEDIKKVTDAFDLACKRASPL
ncbi:hypothetical protein BGX20_011557 [Mortierella sp. AD010]|nr:hypothetical protein BGX20_011557 [Mortierella sp. AD010]